MARVDSTDRELTIAALAPETWDAFAGLAERHNGVFGGKISVLYNGTRSLFEQVGITYVRPKGTRNCVMRVEVS